MKRGQMKFFPNFFLRELMAWYIALGVLGALAAYCLGTRGQGRTVCSCPAGIRPEWYFMFMFQTLKKIPAKSVVCRRRCLGNLGVWSGGMSGCCCRSSIKLAAGAGEDSSVGAGVFALSYIVAMTIYGYMAK